MKPTIVSLEGGEDGSEITFEQAFGEFSEARGRGRARRNKRKTERQQMRIARRRARKKARQEMRAEQQEARQSRKDVRSSRKKARKGDDESESEEKNEGGSGDSGSGDSGSGDSGSGDSGSVPPINQEGDSTKDNQGEGQGEYQGEGGGYSADDEGQNPEGANAVVDSETGESDEESGFTGDCNFDGAIMLSPEDAEWNEYFSSANGYAKINPKVKALARGIEQHKEKIGRQKSQHDKIVKHIRSGQGDDIKKEKVLQLRKMIFAHKRMLATLETKLANYSKFEGDYSEVNGGKRAVSRRKAEVRHAKKRARNERKQARLQTKVEFGLQPEFSNQRIEIPSESSNFSGTGLIGLDDQNDIDAPETRKFDLIFSNVEGDEAKKKKRKKLIIGVSIGLAVGVLAIVLIKKFGKK